jgi:hypothetical protein
MGAARRVRFISPNGFCSRFAHTVPVDHLFPSAGPCVACLEQFTSGRSPAPGGMATLLRGHVLACGHVHGHAKA